jgi:hypothetical protein
MNLRTLENWKRVTTGFTPSVCSLMSSAVLFACLAAVVAEEAKPPRPPAPEPIEVTVLPLPPTAQQTALAPARRPSIRTVRAALILRP